MTKPVDTLGQALDSVYQQLLDSEVYCGHGTDDLWDEAVLLVLSACGERYDASAAVLEQPLLAEQAARISEWLTLRVQQRVPLPYLLGKAWFAGLEFRCDRRALVPRSPLAELIINDYAPWWDGVGPRRLLDLCSGGGCIGIAAAVHNEHLQVVLGDIDTDALALAEENIVLHKVAARVRTCHSDVFAGLAKQQFDLILSNPPYVNASDLADMPAEYRAEPAIGLGSGVDGLDITRRILADAEEFLTDGGLLFLELGNSWVALDELLAKLPLTWLEFSNGGHGVLMLRKTELAAVRAELAC